MFYQMMRTNGPAKLEKEKIKSRFQKTNLTVCTKSDRVAQLNVIIRYMQVYNVHTMEVVQC